MIYLLLGKDDFSKKEWISELQAKTRAELADFGDEVDQNTLQTALQSQGLFSAKKLIVARNGLSKLDFPVIVSAAKKSQDELVFVEDALDKRKSETKEILKTPGLEVKEFNMPVGPEFRKWVEDAAKKKGLKFSKTGLQEFLGRMGIDQGEFGQTLYDLWQADVELGKLAVFAQGQEVSKEDVAALVSENFDDNIFKITNAIADKNRQQALDAMQKYMQQVSGNDEKGALINLSAILSEQFRSILAIQDLLSRGTPDAAIQKSTGFSPGRLFIHKKLASRFTAKQLTDALKKMELLDQEIKSSQGPANLQFYLIINSLMS